MMNFPEKAQKGLVSVVVPTFNRRELVCDTLESVFAQTYGPVEAIVVDNASTDGTRETLQARYGERLRYVYLAERGLSNARNRGMAASRGEFIAMLDDDDLWEPAKLAEQIRRFERPTVNVVYCDAYFFRRTGLPLGRYSERYPPAEGNVFEPLFRQDFAVCSTLVFRRAALERAGVFNPRYHVVEEYDLMLRLALQGEAAYVDQPLVWYRLHPHNTVRLRRRLLWEETLDLCRRTAESRPEIMSRPLGRQRMTEVEFRLGAACVQERRFWEGMEWIGRSLRRDGAYAGRVFVKWITGAAAARISSWARQGFGGSVGGNARGKDGQKNENDS